MSAKRPIAALIQLCILGLGAYGVWRLAHPAPQPYVDPDWQEDLREQSGVNVLVHVGQIEQRTLHSYLTAYGTVQPAPARNGMPAAGAAITAPIAAIISNVACAEGEHVTKGQILFSLDDRAATAAVDRDRAVLTADEQNLARLTASPAAGGKPADTNTPPPWLMAWAQQQRDIAQADLQQAIANQALLNVTAPLEGTVTVLNIRPGEVADPRTVAVELVDLKRLVIAADVPSAALATIHPGQQALLDLPKDPALIPEPATEPAPEPDSAEETAAPPQPATGTVQFVDAAIDPQTGMGSVDILPADVGTLRPGQFVRVRIVSQERADCLVVPAEALVHNAQGDAAIGVVNDTQESAQLTAVQPGLREGDLVEIHGSGLHEGQKIVTTGAYALTQSTRIRVQSD
jgi:RND family efflux transporter MFP subunit